MVDSAIEAMADWMRSGRGANHGGAFAAAHATDELVETRARERRRAARRRRRAEIVFGPSMTALTMRFAGAVGRTLQPGDEIVCTRLDHDANVRPWVIAAERAGATVRFAEPEPETLELPARAVEAVLSERTRWVAVTAASNAVGTVPDLRASSPPPTRAGARVYVDAVHAAPHRPHRRRRARLRRARLLGLQVVRPARRDPVGARPSCSPSCARTSSARRPTSVARPLGARHAAVRGAGRRRAPPPTTRASMDWDAVRAHEERAAGGARSTGSARSPA